MGSPVTTRARRLARLRRALIAFVFLLALFTHLRLGLEGWPAALYETLRIFLLDGSFEPPAGASRGWLATLWVLRFAAPLVLLNEVWNLAFQRDLLRVITPLWSGHVVVAGAGSLGVRICEEARARSRRGPLHDLVRPAVVVIEPDADNPHLPGLQAQGVAIVIGDARESSALLKARVPAAKAFIAAARSDIVNVEACWRARELVTGGHAHEGAQLVTMPHVFDLHLWRRLGEAEGRIEPFNSYQLAATALITPLLADAPPEAFVVVGFGRFGSACLAVLLEQTALADGRLVVADRNPRTRGRLDDQLRHGPAPASPRTVRFCAGDARDLDIWAELEGARSVCVLVCTDNDVRNLELALSFRQQLERAPLGEDGVQATLRVVTRMSDCPKSYLEAQGIVAESLDDLRCRDLPWERLVPS